MENFHHSEKNQKWQTKKKNTILQLKLIEILRTSSEKSFLYCSFTLYREVFFSCPSVVKFLSTGHQSLKSDTNDQRRLRTKPQSYFNPSLTVTVRSHDFGPFILEILWNRFYGVTRISLGIFSSRKHENRDRDRWPEIVLKKNVYTFRCIHIERLSFETKLVSKIWLWISKVFGKFLIIGLTNILSSKCFNVETLCNR